MRLAQSYEMHKNVHLENIFMVASFLSFLLVISAVRNKTQTNSNSLSLRAERQILARPDTDIAINGIAQESQVIM